MQLDAGEVRDPGERGRVVDDREHGRVPARERDRHLVHVVRVLRRHALLVEEVALDAVREPLHVERPPAQVRQRVVGDVEVVADEVALGEPARREEDLVLVRERDVVTADSHAVGSHAMRKAAIALVLPLSLLAFVAAGCGGSDNGSTTESTASTETATTNASASSAPCDKQNLTLLNQGVLTIGTDNPAYPPWFGGGSVKGSKWQINDPSTGKGFESAVAYAVAKELGFSPSEVQWTYVPFNRVVRARQEVVRLRHQPDLDHAGPREGRHVQLALLRPEPGDRRAQGQRHRQGDHGRRPAGLQARRPARHDELRLHQEQHQAARARPPSSRRTPARSRR